MDEQRASHDLIRVPFNYIYSYSNVSDAYGVQGADSTMTTQVVRLAYGL